MLVLKHALPDGLDYFHRSLTPAMTAARPKFYPLREEYKIGKIL